MAPQAGSLVGHTDTMTGRFNKSFTQQEPIPEAAIEAAVAVLRSGQLHRYSDASDSAGPTALLEQRFAQYLDLPFALACASGGYALSIALHAAGVEPGDQVLCNGFTLAPVAGALHSVAAAPVWVETTPGLTIDLDHLAHCIRTSEARFLLLSCMRGHMPDMERLLQICDEQDICLVEDCAHTLGAAWDGRRSGTFGSVACFSTQTYKHINSGEGGLLATSDPDIMAKAILYSGSYMLYDRHRAAPEPAAFEPYIYTTPNYSGRMDHLRAAVLLPQLEQLDANIERWNRRYRIIEAILASSSAVALEPRSTREFYVGSSIQFRLPTWSAEAIACFRDRCSLRGVVLKWFGEERPRGYTSRYDHWQFFAPESEATHLSGAVLLPQTTEILSTLLDMRIPLTFSEADCERVATIIAEEIRLATSATEQPHGR